jgi:hypothetical protein
VTRKKKKILMKNASKERGERVTEKKEGKNR